MFNRDKTRVNCDKYFKVFSVGDYPTVQIDKGVCNRKGILCSLKLSF
jgi:hypothetical protein